MNRNWILFLLREGLKELTQTIAAIESNPAYDEINFGIAMAHLYGHVNTAWNSRSVDPERTSWCSDDDFYAWRAFPSDIPMGS